MANRCSDPVAVIDTAANAVVATVAGDSLVGGAGNDRLFGDDEGVDRLSGGPSDNYLNTVNGTADDQITRRTDCSPEGLEGQAPQRGTCPISVRGQPAV